ncbi:hypothetical protein AWL63_23675 (plasmid) [Sphingomonas panacis]|uniref:Acyl-CoA thioesterase n=1 Tax=Sphingomonas panacis TaxID=1560345 RepID=A0A1B3ZIC3_9SPHN|nr:thioesterase family protein [Sphingomonas panacis]AOH87171.1 hypothetical protein AWL63_23675 [Sphingomonas panacis]
MTQFSDILESMTLDAERYSVVVPDDWLQGRTTYGGLSAALSVAAAERTLVEEIPLRSAQFCFVGPTYGEMSVRPAILRRGKATTVMGVDLHGRDDLAVRATLVFGRDRASSYEHPCDGPPQVAGPDSCEPFFVGPGTPAFASHFEARRAGGAALVSGARTPDFLVWVRHRDRTEGSDMARLVALGDALPPPAMALFREPAPISTITWSMDFPIRPKGGTAADWYLVESCAEAVSAGYSTQSMRVWSANGEALMTGRQNVAIFA